MMTWQGRWPPHSGQRWSGRSWRSRRRRRGTSCPRTRQQSQTLRKKELQSVKIESFGVLKLIVKLRLGMYIIRRVEGLEVGGLQQDLRFKEWSFQNHLLSTVATKLLGFIRIFWEKSSPRCLLACWPVLFVTTAKTGSIERGRFTELGPCSA